MERGRTGYSDPKGRKVPMVDNVPEELLNVAEKEIRNVLNMYWKICATKQ